MAKFLSIFSFPYKRGINKIIPPPSSCCSILLFFFTVEIVRSVFALDVHMCAIPSVEYHEDGTKKKGKGWRKKDTSERDIRAKLVFELSRSRTRRLLLSILHAITRYNRAYHDLFTIFISNLSLETWMRNSPLLKFCSNGFNCEQGDEIFFKKRRKINFIRVKNLTIKDCRVKTLFVFLSNYIQS